MEAWTKFGYKEGWDYNDAPSLHQLLKHIKAVGIVVDDKVRSDPSLGACLKVKWVWHGHEAMGKIDDKYNVRNITLYEEVNPMLLKQMKP
ncbi:MAG: hypothetical protein ABH874_06295 [Methanobacteriota archaeon]